MTPDPALGDWETFAHEAAAQLATINKLHPGEPPAPTSVVIGGYGREAATMTALGPDGDQYDKVGNAYFVGAGAPEVAALIGFSPMNKSTHGLRRKLKPSLPLEEILRQNYCSTNAQVTPRPKVDLFLVTRNTA
jgi:hypothetical protein